jgi:hypothetical protein
MLYARLDEDMERPWRMIVLFKYDSMNVLHVRKKLRITSCHQFEAKIAAATISKFMKHR